MNSDELTKKGGTWTKIGFIAHKRHPKGFYMPVKLDIDKKKGTNGMKSLQQPLFDDNGRLIWALPGGGQYVG